ncbi:reprolysin-like metallopeptidase [Kaistella antarctica]|uniref:Por secretion system C-terminal sorting domain n=1 Tax=Kaistella antarctica TaxID=266748 RepID=A0A3S4UV14_9FLAO|nr:M12 family metallo-peptidase [Kaistella antarctica]KEY18429.1 propanediol utilization protein [Kaistella antarctica]SEV85684.1 Por secretion system C-terminal sorting domain-containing protein [Kaistella antarctica]VEI01185.1 Por secretion system C-terminal sorting domain [Kaistella antarctica]
MKKIFTSLICGFLTTTMFGQWSPTSMTGEKLRPETQVKNYYTLDLNLLQTQLNGATEAGKGNKPVIINLPTLNGKIEKFAVYSAPVVAKTLAEKYQLQSYAGVSVDDANKSVRFSLAPNDFQSMVFSDGNYEFIEPQNKSKSVYGVFPKTNRTGKAFECSTVESYASKAELEEFRLNNTATPTNVFNKNSDQKFRTYRLAISVTGEYTVFFGGVPQALAAINATMTRVNGVFEKDFAIRMILQDFPELIYTDPIKDPYSAAGAGAGGAWSLELQRNLTAVIGNAAYDIGHLFGRSGGGGSAGDIGNVCRNPSGTSDGTAKGSAFTSPGSGDPVGDNFDIDYVAHEMGHQFGADHTFSHALHGAPNNSAHMEPGSGSTIMSYAGITNSNVQLHSDPYFLVRSIEQVQTYVNTQSCDVNTAITNTPPVISAMASKTIPKGTAFVLTADATDAENDPLTYTWEEYDRATSAVTTVTGNNLTGAKFRSLPGTSSPSRYFPKLSLVLNGTLSSAADWEAVSNIARTTNFRVTVRDNNPNVAQQQTSIGVQNLTVGAAGPFKITSTKVFNNAPGPLTWDVVGTNAAPYDVSDVKIDYTLDNGVTWTVLSASTPNDGSEDFSFASIPTNTALKIRISAIGNVFYAVAPVTVSAIVNCDGTAPAGVAVSAITNASANVNWGPIANATYKVRYRKVSEPTWIMADAPTNTYAIVGLTEGTNYEVQVAAVCTGTTGAYSASANFTTTVPTYCAAGSTATSFEKISNVQFANINKSSTSTAGYEDFTAVSGNVIKGTSYPFTATSTNSYAADEIRVWIDFNGDKNFDNNELVFVSDIKKSPWTGSIAIPADAKTGPTRMRVRLHDTSIGPNSSACGNSSYGQVEDYTIEIGGLAVGESVNQVNNVQVYPNPATDILNITKVSDKATYTIYSMSGQTVNKGKVVNNKVQVSQLQKGVYIIAVDNNGELSKVKFIKK